MFLFLDGVQLATVIYMVVALVLYQKSTQGLDLVDSSRQNIDDIQYQTALTQQMIINKPPLFAFRDTYTTSIMHRAVPLTDEQRD